ncbi:MAG: MBL fold metallo-hydrolase [Planctomycetota bacterium]
MRIQTLASGSKGNSTLVRAGETTVLVDLGLSVRRAFSVLEEVRVAPASVDALILTHGHLDHTRGAGAFAKKTGAEVVCTEPVMTNAAVCRAKRFRTLAIDGRVAVKGRDAEAIEVDAVAIPHDAVPTVALRLEHGGRRLVVLTDMGRVESAVAARLGGAHALVIEFNHDADLLADGPYPEPLKRRIAGHGGHLSNVEAAWMLARMVGPEMHTVVLAHLSDTNNHPDLARAAAEAALARLGRSDVRVVVAEPCTPLEAIEV